MIQVPMFGSLTPSEASERGAASPGRATRQTLGRKFVRDLQKLWEEQGEAVLRRTAFHNPEKIIAAMVQLMPTQVENVTPTDGISDERLAMMLDLAERMVALRQGAETLHGGPGVSILEGEAVETGGGGPRPLGPSGGGNDVVHTAPSPQNGLPDFSGGSEKSVVPAEEEEVDPASLF